MFLRNKELRLGLLVIVAVSTVAVIAGAWISPECGALVLIVCVTVCAVHLGTQWYRYRRLQKLSGDLEALLCRGEQLPIRDYAEGELSILADQIQKLALHLLGAADALKAEKACLADALADISHQLRTPLTAMNLTAAMLRSPELTPDLRVELTGELRELLGRTQWLVETLLKLSRLDAGMVTLAREPVCVRELIQRSAGPLAIGMELRGQYLEVVCGAERFDGDLVWTAEALGNILKNCMEHTPQGGRITVTATETPLFTQINVEDTGPGFAPEDIPRLFERFYKGRDAAANSCGIGLSLTRTIVTAQNGTVQAMNGRIGAKFQIRFYKQVI